MEEDKQNPEHRSNKVRRRQAAGSSSDSSDVEEQRGREELKCLHRDKSFTTSGSLKIHQRVQTGEKPYSCDHCEKTFLRCSALKAHQRIHIEGELSSFFQSGKDFTESGSSKKQDIDTTEKLFSCDQCEKAFTTLRSLKSHHCVHTAEKSHCCDQCGKTFTHSGNLKTHQRIHTGEKPYGCDQCGKTFSQRTALETHQRIHTGEKPYSCDQCGKAFTFSARVKKKKSSALLSLRLNTGGAQEEKLSCLLHVDKHRTHARIRLDKTSNMSHMITYIILIWARIHKDSQSPLRELLT
ncbi:gastrula zinc finger protein XlCGF7.1-like isoform X3 [Epinephelus moara]|uniref:gastrula zinc finger protein XlCGF7.1-like isoform X3 n=1 Tax=Epinephelus moara TaxID=300413 RepID=UPI00214EAF33|nr:gastrula zinc finger protein XlCGF7.1-like isoform X3 [Epinephelus moara]